MSHWLIEAVKTALWPLIQKYVENLVTAELAKLQKEVTDAANRPQPG